MKITQTSTRCWPYPAGLENFLLSISTELAQLGDEITLLTTNSSGELSIPQLRIGKLPLKNKQSPYPAQTVRLGPNIKIKRQKALLRIGPFHVTSNILYPDINQTDLIHVHSLTDFPNWIPIMLKLKHVPFVITIHDVTPTVANKFESTLWQPFNKYLMLRLLKRFHAVVVPSHVQLNFLKNLGFNPGKSVLIPLCFDNNVYKIKQKKPNNKIREQYNIQSDEFLIISIGRLIPTKRFDLLFLALKTVSKKFNSLKIKCLIIGPDEGYLKNLKIYSHSLGLSNIVHFTKEKNHLETLTILKSANLFIMPSDSEAFNISTIEAMALSVPVIVSSGVGASYLIRQYENGAVFRKSEPEELVKVLTNLLEKPDLLNNISLEGNKTAEKQCSPKSVAKKHHQLYRNVIQNAC